MTHELDVPAEVRAAFAAGPGDEPALGLTPDGLLGSGRRALRRRRAAGTGAAAVAVAAVLAGAFTLAPGAGPGRTGTAGSPVPTTTAAPRTGVQPTTVPTTTAPTTSDPTTPGRSATVPAPPSAVSLPRLTSALKDVVPVPAGATLSGGVSPDVGPLKFVTSQGGWKAAATYRDAAGVGDLFVWLDPPGTPVEDDGCQGRTDCRTWVTAAGDQVGTGVRRQADGVLGYEVVVVRADGLSVLVAATNSARDGVYLRAAPPWTAAQLEKIALDPGLRAASGG